MYIMYMMIMIVYLIDCQMKWGCDQIDMDCSQFWRYEIEYIYRQTCRVSMNLPQKTLVRQMKQCCSS
jgi:hypothetical protein